MKKKNVAITGFYATGSSALIDLLKEYSCIHISSPIDGDYEHVPFYCSGGLFDLGSILMGQCSPYNSDSAINNFLSSIQRLNNNDFGWFGSYRAYLGDDRFVKIAEDLVDEIATIKDRVTANHATKVTFSPVKAVLQIGAKVLYGRGIPKLGRKYIYDGKPMYFAMPTHSEFTRAAKKYTSAYMKFYSLDDEAIEVFDHLVWPQHAELVEDYFEKNFKMIIVNRDARDLYILNKYYLHKPPVSVVKPYFPTEVDAFIDEWQRTITNYDDTEQLLNLNFEDLVYHYDETVAKIENFLGVSSKLHEKAKSSFVPEKSIENTQTFLVCDEWKSEVKRIEEELPQCCYSFPYERKPDKTKWFDTPETVSRKSKKK